ncbi:MAG TPA: 4-hydroxy-tetrahydrodipicolinate synthase [bacterium]|jgi:4-hydroxy-tetrahydrodipicolinate synthase|nr:4-hydroxy-tetrahydrodipicolinate synthase [bacterium]
MNSFSGTITALVTPFKDGRVDEPALRAHVRRQIEGGVSAVVPVGTTGESPTLSHAEADRVIQVSIEEAKGKVQVIAGTGSYDTRASVERTRWAAKAGADAALIVCPYYNKPTQEGIYLHYKAIAEDGGLPVMVYTIPGRSGVNITPETVARLAQLPGIAAVKEASGSLAQMSDVIAAAGERVSVFSGDDALTLAAMAVGAKGVVSVCSNIAPRLMSDLSAAGLKNDFVAARALHYRLLPLFRALFQETNPIGVKAAMALLGLASPELRLPLTPMEAPNAAKLQAALRELGLLKP